MWVATTQSQYKESQAGVTELVSWWVATTQSRSKESQAGGTALVYASEQPEVLGILFIQDINLI